MTHTTQHGTLDLVFTGQNGHTQLVKAYQKNPLRIVRPFEQPDGGLLIYIINPTAGTLEHDRYSINIEATHGAKVVVLTQTANKIHRMQQGYATQKVHIAVDSSSSLEYYPMRNIPFKDSDYRQTLHVQLDEGAKYIMLEGFSMGRGDLFRAAFSRRNERSLQGSPFRAAASEQNEEPPLGEHGSWRRFASRTQIMRQQRLVYLDQFDLSHNASQLGIMSQYRFYAAGWSSQNAQALTADGLHLSQGSTAFGDSWVRMLSHTASDIDQASTHWRNAQRGQALYIAGENW